MNVNAESTPEPLYYSVVPSGIWFVWVLEPYRYWLNSSWNLTCYCQDALSYLRWPADFVMVLPHLFIMSMLITKYLQTAAKQMPFLLLLFSTNKQILACLHANTVSIICITPTWQQLVNIIWVILHCNKLQFCLISYPVNMMSVPLPHWVCSLVFFETNPREEKSFCHAFTSLLVKEHLYCNRNSSVLLHNFYNFKFKQNHATVLFVRMCEHVEVLVVVAGLHSHLFVAFHGDYALKSTVLMNAKFAEVIVWWRWQ